MRRLWSFGSYVGRVVITGLKSWGGGRAQNKLDLLALPLKARYKFLNARDKAAGWLSLKLIKREKTYRPLNPLKYIKVG